MKAIVIPEDRIKAIRTSAKQQHRCVAPDLGPGMTPQPQEAPYQVGDTIYIQEGWRAEELVLYGLDGIRFRSDNEFVPIQSSREAAEAWGDVYKRKSPNRWRNPTHLPEWAARLHLRIVEVGVQRVQDITQEEARYEGYTDLDCIEHKVPTPRDVFSLMWTGGVWEKNPWVYVYTFLRTHPRA